MKQKWRAASKEFYENVSPNIKPQILIFLMYFFVKLRMEANSMMLKAPSLRLCRRTLWQLVLKFDVRHVATPVSSLLNFFMCAANFDVYVTYIYIIMAVAVPHSESESPGVKRLGDRSKKNSSKNTVFT